MYGYVLELRDHEFVKTLRVLRVRPGSAAHPRELLDRSNTGPRQGLDTGFDATFEPRDVFVGRGEESRPVVLLRWFGLVCRYIMNSPSRLAF